MKNSKTTGMTMEIIQQKESYLINQKNFEYKQQ